MKEGFTGYISPLQQFISVCDASAMAIAVVPDRYALHFGDHFLTGFKPNHCMRHCFHFNNINLSIWSKGMLCCTNVYIVQYLTAGYTLLLVNSSHIYFPGHEWTNESCVLFFLLSPSLYQTHQWWINFVLIELKVCGNEECLSLNC